MNWKTSLPHITIIIWGGFIATPWAYSADFPGCPPQTFQTEVVSPIDSSKKILCSKKTSSGFVKHGPEWIYNSQKKLQQKNTYENGELTSSVEADEVVAEKASIPKKTKTDKKDSLKKDYSFIKAILHETLHLWHPLRRPSRGYLALGGFETRTCGINDYTLTRFYKEERESFKLDLKFSRRCSLQGVHELVWNRPLKIELELRDMRDFTELVMQLNLSKTVIKEGEDTYYKIETQITDATLRTKDGGLRFKAYYTLSVDPKKEKALKGHGGELNILEFNSEKIQQNYELKIKTVELP